MRKPDVEVREVVCSETGKPMPKIPLWMADVKVKFISDEARQKHPSPVSMADLEPVRRSIGARSDGNALKDIDSADVLSEEEDYDGESDGGGDEDSDA